MEAGSEEAGGWRMEPDLQLPSSDLRPGYLPFNELR